MNKFLMTTFISLSPALMFCQDTAILGTNAVTLVFEREISGEMHNAIAGDLTSSFGFMQPLAEWIGPATDTEASFSFDKEPNPIPSILYNEARISSANGMTGVAISGRVIEAYENALASLTNGVPAQVAAIVDAVNSMAITNLPVEAVRDLFCTDDIGQVPDSVLTGSVETLTRYRLYRPSLLAYQRKCKLYDGVADWAVPIPAFDKATGNYESSLLFVATNGTVKIYAP